MEATIGAAVTRVSEIPAEGIVTVAVDAIVVDPIAIFAGTPEAVSTGISGFTNSLQDGGEGTRSSIRRQRRNPHGGNPSSGGKLHRRWTPGCIG